LDAFHLSRYEPTEKSLEEPAVQMRRAEQAAASCAHPTVHRIEYRAAFIAASQLRGPTEEGHTSQDVLTEGEIVLQS